MSKPRDHHTKWSKSKRERQIPYDITYIWNQEYDTNEFIYETNAQTEKTNIWLPEGKGDEGRIK